jgi:glycosyltransferase involved in cell wall biosynthesis
MPIPLVDEGLLILMPVVSIIVRTKDRPLLLRRAIQSIFSQNFKEWEIILVNNGGDKAPINQLMGDLPPLCKEKIILVNLEVAYGMEVATNVGLSKSCSEYIAILDDDDTWDSAFLMETVYVLKESKEYDGVVTQTTLVIEKMEQADINIDRIEAFNPKLKKINSIRLARHNLFTTNAFVYRRSMLNKIGCYNEGLPVLGDWDFNLRFIRNGKIAVIRTPLAYYHKRTNFSENEYSNSNLDAHLLWDKKIRCRYLRESPLWYGTIICAFGFINRIIYRVKKRLFIKKAV